MNTDARCASAHTWEVIGDTTFSGPTWCQLADVLFCGHCGRYATRTHTYLDFETGDPHAVAQRQTAEREEYRELIARHRTRSAQGQRERKEDDG